ncbi:MAG: hypothetical protein ICV83_01795 [Cytophagales bacterium]|nr:hypothetical protein [Cytophagales bacterium]
MKKNPLLLLLLLVFAFAVSSCDKKEDPAPPPVVGRWNTDRIILSGFPAPYQGLNGDFSPTLFSIESSLNLLADKKFTYRFSNGVRVTTGGGTWEYSGTSLTLNYDDGNQETYTYEQPRAGEQELKGTQEAVTLPVENPTTGADEEARGQAQFVYRKQQ